MSYIILRFGWCNIIFLNVHGPCEDESAVLKKRFSEEKRRVFDQFPRYDMKILLGVSNAKACRENIYKPKIRNWSLLEISNNNRVRVVKFATFKNLVVKRKFPHCNIHKSMYVLISRSHKLGQIIA
jgi:hypothetical protein